MLLNYSFQAARYIPRSLPKVLATALTAAVLASCGADVSDETAMQESMEVSLAQCEILQYGVVGTPTEPVVVDGEEVNACLLSTSFGQLENTRSITDNLNMIQLKTSWNYEPLVWVLDGVYQLGESKQYQTLDELFADHKAFRLGSSSSAVYAKEGTVVIVHRNAQLSASIQSLDDNLVGGGEWGGVIINGIGAAPECPQTASPEALCNIEGPFGYYGGVSPGTDLIAYGLGFNTNTSQGLPGLYTLGSGTSSVIGEAGAETQVTLEGYEGGTIHSAVTAYAPVAGQVGNVIAYSGNTAITAYGGSWNLFTDTFTGSVPTPYITESASTAVELNEYQGGFAARVSHSNSTAALILNGGEVDLINTTLYDQYNQAGSALALTSTSMLSIDDVVIQGFDTCLAPQDSASQISIGSALLNCSNITNSTSNALAAIADATDLVTGVDPYLNYIWAVSNDSLSFTNVDDVSQLGAGNSNTGGTYSPVIIYPECMGVGSLAEDTMLLGGVTYQVCDLNATVVQSVTLYSNFSIEGRLTNGGSADYNPKNIAWRINGQIQVGNDFSGLSDGEQQAALTDPVRFNLVSGSQLIASSGSDSELIIQPDVLFKAKGSSASAIEITSDNTGAGEITSAWRGMTINGSDALPEDNTQVDIQYLRLFDTGEDGQAALTLNNVGAGSDIAYLDIYGAGGDGLTINAGAVNVDNLVMANIAGDQIAWSTGYTGTIETAVISPGDSSTGSVLHGVNDSTDYDAEPRSRPVLSNITATGMGSDNTAILLEQGSGLLLFNSVFSEFATCLDIDDAETAALLSSDPLGIVFDGVVLDCDSTLAAEDEDSGYDYGYDVANSSGVYEEEAVLDTGYVVTGAETATSTDLSSYADLIGDAYNYLNGDGYIGAVADSDDDWYANWSDSVVISLDEACDYSGMLSDFEIYGEKFEYDVNGDGEISFEEGNFYPAIKICRIISGTYTEDLTISPYTGETKVAVDEYLNNGGNYENIESEVLVSGWAINSFTGEILYVEDEVVQAAPTHWSVKGVVHIGEGHKEITDSSVVPNMKTDPVTLTVKAGVELSGETAGSTIHITRGGHLVLQGEEEYDAEEQTPEGSKRYLNINMNLVVDGFGRHNQCPDAATAETGSQVCNIEGKYGYYGGYDNDYSNFDIQYVNLYKTLALNAAGSGVIDHLVLRGDRDEVPDIYLGADRVVIDGGVPAFTDLYFDADYNRWGSVIVWNHGYQGTIQYVWAYERLRLNRDGYNAELMSDDSNRFYPMLRGQNVTDAEREISGSASAMPQSMPTIANLSAYFQEYDPWNEVSSAIDLSNGSGLFLYNSVLGGRDDEYNKGEGVDICFYIDDTVKAQLDTTLVVDNLAYSCADFSNNPDSDTYLVDQVAASTISDAHSYNWVFATGQPKFYDADEAEEAVDGVYALPDMNVRYPSESVMMGDDLNWNESMDEWLLDYSASQSVNADVIEDNNYMGAFDYTLVLDAGMSIGD